MTRRVMRSFCLVFLALLTGCAASPTGDDDAVSATEANLDTTGCSGTGATRTSGPVEVHSTRPHSRSCWNIPESGLDLTYSWLQRTGEPERDNIGFWTSLNGADVYAKAAWYDCTEVFGGGPSHDTSGERTFRCAAHARLSFQSHPKLLDAGYEGHRRRVWDVRVAASLDDSGTWDSLNGANYRFEL